jgi:glutamate-1-semialdehyde 2,1-aminomutase
MCADQPFFSTDDWFIGTTPMDAGIPPAMTSLSLKFRYNDLDDLARLSENPGRVACRSWRPPPPGTRAGYPGRHRTVHANGAVRADEMTRFDGTRARRPTTSRPSTGTLAAMANGLCCRRSSGGEIMEPAGCGRSGPRSSCRPQQRKTSAGCRLATICVPGARRHRASPANRRGATQGITEAARRLGVDPYFQVLGHRQTSCTRRDQEGYPSQPFRTLFLRRPSSVAC